MKKKQFIVLYGKSNQGKTRTLMELVIMLGGGGASLERDLKTYFMMEKDMMMRALSLNMKAILFM